MSRTSRVVMFAVLVLAVIGAGAWSGGLGASGATQAPESPGCCSHTHARAQAIVKPDGTPARSFGVTGTSRVAPGVYCIGLPATVLTSGTAPVATQDIAFSPGTLSTTVTVAINSAAPACPPNSVEVETFQVTPANGSVPADEAFSVVIA